MTTYRNVLLSYPRSGNHLTRFFIELLSEIPTKGCEDNDLDIPLHKNSFSEKIPFNISKPFDQNEQFWKYHEIPKITISENINSPSSINIINSYKPDILVSVLGNQIFKKQIINLAPMGCINLHTALLPKYRGLMPTFWVLKNNEKPVKMNWSDLFN